MKILKKKSIHKKVKNNLYRISFNIQINLEAIKNSKFIVLNKLIFKVF